MRTFEAIEDIQLLFVCITWSESQDVAPVRFSFCEVEVASKPALRIGRREDVIIQFPPELLPGRATLRAVSTLHTDNLEASNLHIFADERERQAPSLLDHLADRRMKIVLHKFPASKIK